MTGLDSVVVAETRLSGVDGEAGRLRVAGRSIEELAPGGLVGAAACLWDGPVTSQALGRARSRLDERLVELDPALTQGAMSALQTGLGLLLDDDAAPIDISAAVGVTAASWVRHQRGLPALAADPTLSPAADWLRVALDDDDPAKARAFDTYLATVVDHGLNASTFTARVVASTGASDLSAVRAAVGALSGPLHGGAPGPVLDMLDAIATPERAHTWLLAELDAGRRIMGMGHRVYRVRDPRAAVLEHAVEQLHAKGLGGPRLALARQVEDQATRLLAQRHPDRPLRANVEFATAVLLETIGLPRRAFSLAFATGRVVGWLAHTAEQRATGRLLRPRLAYVGG